jgi:hypothetical protein
LLQKRLNEAHALLETLQTNDESGEFTTSMGLGIPAVICLDLGEGLN